MTRASSSLASSSRAVKLVSWLNWRTFSACDWGIRKVKPATSPYPRRHAASLPAWIRAWSITFENETQRLKRKSDPGEPAELKKEKAWRGEKRLLHLFACKLRIIKAPKENVHVLGGGGRRRSMQPVTKNRWRGEEGSVSPQRKNKKTNCWELGKCYGTGGSLIPTLHIPQRDELANCLCVSVCVLRTCTPLLKEKMKIIKAGRSSHLPFFWNNRKWKLFITKPFVIETMGKCLKVKTKHVLPREGHFWVGWWLVWAGF